MLDSVSTKEIKFALSSESYVKLNKIIKEENQDTILASLSPNLIKKYLEISTKSENFFFYICEYKSEIVGYALLVKKPSFLISEFKIIKYSILINLLMRFKFKTIINIFLSMYKIDLLLTSKTNKDIISKNLNLNLLAINKNFQSKGIGKAFVLDILNDIKKKHNFQTIIVETYDKRTASFYQNKLNFYYLGKKLRLFKNLYIYRKEF